MLNNRITADYEFFVNRQLSLQLVRAVGDLLTGVTIHRAKGETNPIKLDYSAAYLIQLN